MTSLIVLKSRIKLPLSIRIIIYGRSLNNNLVFICVSSVSMIDRSHLVSVVSSISTFVVVILRPYSRVDVNGKCHFIQFLLTTFVVHRKKAFEKKSTYTVMHRPATEQFGLKAKPNILISMLTHYFAKNKRLTTFIILL